VLSLNKIEKPAKLNLFHNMKSKQNLDCKKSLLWDLFRNYCCCCFPPLIHLRLKLWQNFQSCRILKTKTCFYSPRRFCHSIFILKPERVLTRFWSITFLQKNMLKTFKTKSQSYKINKVLIKAKQVSSAIFQFTK